MLLYVDDRCSPLLFVSPAEECSIPIHPKDLASAGLSTLELISLAKIIMSKRICRNLNWVGMDWIKFDRLKLKYQCQFNVSVCMSCMSCVVCVRSHVLLHVVSMVLYKWEIP